MNSYHFGKFGRTYPGHPSGWPRFDAIAAKRASKEFIIDLVVRDKAEAFVANTLSLSRFFIIIAITHEYLIFFGQT